MLSRDNITMVLAMAFVIAVTAAVVIIADLDPNRATAQQLNSSHTITREVGTHYHVTSGRLATRDGAGYGSNCPSDITPAKVASATLIVSKHVAPGNVWNGMRVVTDGNDVSLVGTPLWPSTGEAHLQIRIQCGDPPRIARDHWPLAITGYPRHSAEDRFTHHGHTHDHEGVYITVGEHNALRTEIARTHAPLQTRSAWDEAQTNIQATRVEQIQWGIGNHLSKHEANGLHWD